jgi:hypothetical protein
MRHLVNMIEDLKERGVGFHSISDGMIYTTSASGEPILNIFSALAQFERRLVQERTKAGLAAARARGRKGGRPRLNRQYPKVILAHPPAHRVLWASLGKVGFARLTQCLKQPRPWCQAGLLDDCLEDPMAVIATKGDYLFRTYLCRVVCFLQDRQKLG